MSAQITSESSDTTTKPTIFLLSLENELFFDSIFARLIDAIAAKATLKRATEATAALDFLSANTPSAIFITDPGLLEAANAAVLERVVSYVRGGGIAVIGGIFSNLVHPLDLGDWFRSQWGLLWQYAEYHRTTVHLNPHAQRVPQMGLPAAYSQKAIFLKNVGSNASWYLPLDDSMTDESDDFHPQSEDDRQTPVAFTALGYGWLGYIGDVNAEQGSDAVALAMCGLL
jgi:hypothetical protein